MKVELIYFDGCPNAAQARENLREAIRTSGQDLTWSEWDLMDPSTPADFRRFGSPTILVDGEDVTGVGAETVAMACRAEGAPSVELITPRALHGRQGGWRMRGDDAAWHGVRSQNTPRVHRVLAHRLVGGEACPEAFGRMNCPPHREVHG